MLSGFELYPRWVPLLIILISKERGLQGTLLKRGLKLKLDILYLAFPSLQRTERPWKRGWLFPLLCQRCIPPFPQIKDGKMVRFGVCAASSLMAI